MREIKFRVWDKLLKKYIGYQALLAYRSEEYDVEQFLGLKDRDGEDIYEGDIVEYIEKLDEHGDYQKLKGVIKYDSGYAAYGIGAIPGNDCWNFLSDYGVRNIKVIGNIHTNPEQAKM